MLVSIILPTYNRAGFLPEAFAAIKRQTYTNWELIVVDDAGTDQTETLTAEFARSVSQTVRYIRLSENLGAYGARNRGLDESKGDAIAFYDSDDLWMDHHLKEGTEALIHHPDIDWVFGALRRIDASSGEVIEESNQYINGKPKPFLSLTSERRGQAYKLTDPTTLPTAIGSNFFGGLQTAVIRRRVFRDYRFAEKYRNGQDRFAALTAMSRGFKFAYFRNLHVLYRIHTANDSLVNSTINPEKQMRILQQLVEQYKEFLKNVDLTADAKSAVRRQLLHIQFWNLGYVVQWMNGLQADALRSFEEGLRYWKWSLSCWKTYLLCRLRTLLKHRVKQPERCLDL